MAETLPAPPRADQHVTARAEFVQAQVSTHYQQQLL